MAVMTRTDPKKQVETSKMVVDAAHREISTTNRLVEELAALEERLRIRRKVNGGAKK